MQSSQTEIYCRFPISDGESIMLTDAEFRSGLGVLIRKLRQRKGISITDLSLDCDVDYSTINLIENGKQNPRAYTLYKILIDLDIDLDSLLREKQQEQISAEELLIQKIRLLSEEQQKSLIAFLNKFEITEK